MIWVDVSLAVLDKYLHVRFLNTLSSRSRSGALPCQILVILEIVVTVGPREPSHPVILVTSDA